MRNLKKILALVLALIMSLSLMATAGATDFKDDENVGDVYRQAVEVLSDLNVFVGDQNGQFNPDQSITRAEVAAIIYRISTGDVTNERNDTYAPYNQFKDINVEDWYAGYVTYCANAGYVKGRNTGNFDAKDPVTGYEVLAMILRAVGYDKNNEFVGTNWQTATASLATQKGVLQNITSATSLGAPATREVVAELLFRSILLPQVTYNAATLSYDANRETLAKEHLDMEQVEGVVVANEYADLNGYTPIAEGTTRLDLGDDKTVDLAITTGLDSLGERRWAYIQHSTTILGSLEDSGNTVLENEGARVKTTSGELEKWAAPLKLGSAAQFINFDEATRYTSDILIRYTIDLTELIYWTSNENSQKFAYLMTASDNSSGDLLDYTDANEDGYVNNALILYENWVDGNEAYVYVDEDTTHLMYDRTIHIGKEVTSIDLDLIFNIFDYASGVYVNNSTQRSWFGSVRVGTQSNDDISDSRDWTYDRFVKEYLTEVVGDVIRGAGNGEWLKVVDNDNDGNADYIFRTWYVLSEITGYNTRTDLWSFSDDLNVNTETPDGYNPVFLAPEGETYEPAVGDVVVYSLVDGQALIRKAASVQDSVVKYNYEHNNIEESIDTAAGENYGSSDIVNGTDMGDSLIGLPYNVEYIFYFDEFGYVRAYEPVDADKHYGLLTEMYTSTSQNSLIVTDTRATAELGIPVEDSSAVDIAEYNVTDGTRSPFIGIPQQIVAPGVVTLYNYLQRAIAHLGLDEVPTVATAYPWSLTNGIAMGEEFDYNKTADAATSDGKGYVYNANTVRWSATNLALYSIDENKNADLDPATQYAYDKNNNRLYYADWDKTNNLGYNPADGSCTQIIYERYTKAQLMDNYSIPTDAAFEARLGKDIFPVYEYDYVMLDVASDAKTVGSGQREWLIHEDDTTLNTGLTNNSTINSVMDNKLFAVDDTEYFIVTVDAKTGRATGATHYTGFRNVPAIPTKLSDGTNNILSVYAVGKNTSYNVAGEDYWVADAIVIEIVGTEAAGYDQLVLVYGDQYRRARSTDHTMSAIDCKTGNLVTVEVNDGWNDYNKPGFYALYGAKTEGDMITADAAIRIEGSADAIKALGYYIDQKVIHAGRATYVDTTLDKRSDYLTVEMYGEGGKTEQVTMGKDIPWYSIWSKTGKDQTLVCDLMSKPDYEKLNALGHYLVWVDDGKGNAIFVVDTTFVDPDYRYTDYTPALFLNDGRGNGICFDIINEQIEAYVDSQPLTGSAIKIEAYVNGTKVTHTLDENAVAQDPAVKGQWTIDASKVKYNDGTAYTAIRLDVVDTKAGSYTSAVQLDGGDLIVTGVKGTVTVKAILTTNTSNTLTITQGLNATITKENVKINNVVCSTPIGTGISSIKQGSRVDFTFTTASDMTGLYTVGSTTYHATKVSEADGKITWKGTCYMGASATTITVSGAATTNYCTLTVSSGFEFVAAPAIAKDSNMPSLTIRSADKTDGKNYVVNSIKIGTTTLTKKDSATAANEYAVDADTGVITFGANTKATGDIVIEAALETKTFTVTVKGNGVVNVSGTYPVTVNYGDKFSTTFTVVEGYSAITLVDPSVATISGNTVTIEKVTGNVTIDFKGLDSSSVCVAAAKYLETAMAGERSTIKVSGTTVEADAKSQLIARANELLATPYPTVKVTALAWKGSNGSGSAWAAINNGTETDEYYVLTLNLKENGTAETKADTGNIVAKVTDTDHVALAAAKATVEAAIPTYGTFNVTSEANAKEQIAAEVTKTLTAANTQVTVKTDGVAFGSSGAAYPVDMNEGTEKNSGEVTVTLTLNGKELTTTAKAVKLLDTDYAVLKAAAKKIEDDYVAPAAGADTGIVDRAKVAAQAALGADSVVTISNATDGTPSGTTHTVTLTLSYSGKTSTTDVTIECTGTH